MTTKIKQLPLTTLSALTQSMVVEFNKMKIRAAITGIKTRDELLTALKVGTSFVSGPFITTALHEPLKPRQISPADLPLSDLELEAA